MRTDLSAALIEQASDVDVNAARFRRHLRASGLSPKTETTYLEGVARLRAFLAERGMPDVVASITREHLEEWLIAMREAGRKPATVAARYRSVQQFFKWAAEEDLVPRSPMATMRPPRIPESPPPVMRGEALTALLRSVKADRSFAGRRDTALLRVFFASGARLAEIANLRWNPADPTANDVELDMGLIRVIGKGGRERPIYVGAKAIKALDRYVYDQRAKHRLAALPWLWLGPKGRFTDSCRTCTRTYRDGEGPTCGHEFMFTTEEGAGALIQTGEGKANRETAEAVRKAVPRPKQKPRLHLRIHGPDAKPLVPRRKTEQSWSRESNVVADYIDLFAPIVLAELRPKGISERSGLVGWPN